ncbi:hypothetical protein ACR77X_17150 [Bacteroides salyersiae]
MKALVWSFIWFSYLCVSRQVENLFPKEERMVFKRDKYFAVSLLVIPALLLLIYFISYLGNSTAVMSLSPEKGEYTDGVVAFRAPKGLLCERVDSISDNIYHSFESGDSIWGTIVGGYMIRILLKLTSKSVWTLGETLRWMVMISPFLI